MVAAYRLPITWATRKLRLIPASANG
jgi:hypothetical protein